MECGVPREELFITTKVWIDHYGYEECKASVEESLRKLKQIIWTYVCFISLLVIIMVLIVL